ncbi:hypothetical protein ACIBBD_24115 [Streptomyces sp. NPDC051315]|uniref:hypothetical protein n=1 Tax=Streptomyces sp. NPDC051315 TaxID=3365650 RepID=UPI00378EAE60
MSLQQWRTESPAAAGETVLRIFAGSTDDHPSDPLAPLRAALVQSVEAVAAAVGHVPPASPPAPREKHR